MFMLIEPHCWTNGRHIWLSRFFTPAEPSYFSFERNGKYFFVLSNEPLRSKRKKSSRNSSWGNGVAEVVVIEGRLYMRPRSTSEKRFKLIRSRMDVVYGNKFETKDGGRRKRSASLLYEGPVYRFLVFGIRQTRLPVYEMPREMQ